MRQELHDIINRMSRAKVQQILESYGFAVYDNETLRSLRTALKANVIDGTIPESVIEES